MTTVRLRPTFSVPTDLEVSDLFSRLQRAVDDEPEYEGKFASRHALISVSQANRHFWSPWLHVEVREQEDVHTVFGRFSPHPSIWTAFTFSYLAIGVLIFFSAIFGWSQQLAGESAWTFFLIPVWLVIALLLWVVSQVGQRLASDQMHELKAFLLDCASENGGRAK